MSGETGSSLWGQNKPRVREQEGAGRSWEGGSKTQSCNQPCLLRPSPQAHCCLGGHESPAVTPLPGGQQWNLSPGLAGSL